MEIPLSLFCRVKNSRLGDVFGAGLMVGLGIAVMVGTDVGIAVGLGIAVLVGTGSGVLIGLGIAVLVAIGVGVLITLGIAVLVGTGIAVLGTSITEEVVAPELVESTDWGEVVEISCVHAANTARLNIVINILY